MTNALRAAATLLSLLVSAAIVLAGEGRPGYVIVKKDQRRIEGKISITDEGRVKIEIGRGSSTDFAADEVTIAYTDTNPAPAGSAPGRSAADDVATLQSGLQSTFVDQEARFVLERPGPEWRLQKPSSPEARVVMALTEADAFLAVLVQPAPNASAAYLQPTRELARKVQGDVERDLKSELDKFSGVKLDVGELFASPVVEATYEGNHPGETTLYAFIEQRFVHNELLYVLRAGAEKKSFQSVEGRLREAFSAFSFLTARGCFGSTFNDLDRGFAIEAPTERWTIDDRCFDDREPVVLRAEEGKAEIRLVVTDAGKASAGEFVDEHLKPTDRRIDFVVGERREEQRGGINVALYRCSYFEGRSVTKREEQGLVAVVSGRAIHAIGLAPVAGAEARDLQREVAKALDGLKVFDPKRTRLGEGARASEECARGIEAARHRQFQDAVASLSEAIKLCPDYARAYLWRATCHVELKAWKEYREDLARACDLDRRPEMQRLVGGVHLAEVQSRLKDSPKQWAEACRAWKDALRLDPRNEKVRREFIRFYQDWWADLKRTNPGAKAKDAAETIEDARWSDRELDPVLATILADAGATVLQADKKQWSRARGLGTKALGYDKGCRTAQDLVKQCDEVKKQLEAGSRPRR